MKYHDIYKTHLDCKSKDEVFKFLLDTLKTKINGWDYFVNWIKVFGNIDEIEVDLNILNYLIGKEDIETKFAELLKKHPQIFHLIPILIACREKDFKILSEYRNGSFDYFSFSFHDCEKLSDEQIKSAVTFARSVGFLDLLKEKRLKNIVDYVIGVEVGLDSNGRKNRSGTTMEAIVEFFINDICSKNRFEYMTQATSKKIHDKWGFKLSVDKSSRSIDFAVNNRGALYLIETNFYGGSGSKLKSTAGEYMTLHNLLTESGHKFLWITDGIGWIPTRRPLEETFNHIDYILNLEMITKGLLEAIILEKL
ncbi:MAG: type II restriction endonuclease [bacterium]